MTRKRLSLILMIISFTGLAVAFLSTQQIYYSDGPWSGRIIDVETKKAIQGTVVVASWVRVYQWIISGHSTFFDAKEVLTDSEGIFVIPSYKAFNLCFFPFTKIDHPRFEVFKPGYSSGYISDSPLRLVDNRTRSEIFKRGVILELRRLKTREERLKNWPSWPVEAREKLPVLSRLIDEERQDLGMEPIGTVGRWRK
jgi:hypothetical protein